jgi:hypothetical protein
MEYRIELAARAREQVKALSGRKRASILDAVRDQLRHEPCRPTGLDEAGELYRPLITIAGIGDQDARNQ